MFDALDARSKNRPGEIRIGLDGNAFYSATIARNDDDDSGQSDRMPSRDRETELQNRKL